MSRNDDTTKDEKDNKNHRRKNTIGEAIRNRSSGQPEFRKIVEGITASSKLRALIKKSMENPHLASILSLHYLYKAPFKQSIEGSLIFLVDENSAFPSKFDYFLSQKEEEINVFIRRLKEVASETILPYLEKTVGEVVAKSNGELTPEEEELLKGKLLGEFLEQLDRVASESLPSLALYLLDRIGMKEKFTDLIHTGSIITAIHLIKEWEQHLQRIMKVLDTDERSYREIINFLEQNGIFIPLIAFSWCGRHPDPKISITYQVCGELPELKCKDCGKTMKRMVLYIPSGEYVDLFSYREGYLLALTAYLLEEFGFKWKDHVTINGREVDLVFSKNGKKGILESKVFKLMADDFNLGENLRKMLSQIEEHGELLGEVDEIVILTNANSRTVIAIIENNALLERCEYLSENKEKIRIYGPDNLKELAARWSG